MGKISWWPEAVSLKEQLKKMSNQTWFHIHWNPGISCSSRNDVNIETYKLLGNDKSVNPELLLSLLSLLLYTYIWVNYNISLSWIKAIWGWFPWWTMIPVRSQWGRYNLPKYMFYMNPFCSVRSIGPIDYTCIEVNHWRESYMGW